MSDRKAELERKKAKLQALREEKDRRRREKEQKDAEEAVSRASTLSSLDSRRDVDEMLSSLGVAPVRDVLSSLSSRTSLTPPQTASPDVSLSNLGNEKLSIQSQGSSKKSLMVVPVQSTDIPPKESVVYTKQTQTTASSGHERDGYMEDWYRPRKAHATEYYDEYNLNPGLEWEDEFTVITFDDESAARQGEDDEPNSLGITANAGFHGKLPPGILAHGLPTVKEVPPAVTAQEQKKPEEEKKEKKVRELTADEKQTIMLSSDFQKFISRAGTLIERALAENVDIYTDYIGGSDAEDSQDDKTDARLSLVRQFYCDRWSRGRCITCLDWCSFHPELLLASYHNSDEAPHDPDGVCLVWNTKFKKSTPEDIFHCQSPVMSACFAKFHPNLILGGTYSGQIVVWDNRVPKRTPIQRTPLSSSAHTHPVYCLSVVGTPNAHNVISVSTDGLLCSWSLDMLSKPETLELQPKQARPAAVTCMAFPHGDVNSFIVGSEEGDIHLCYRHGGRAGVSESITDGHAGPVMGVSTHSAVGSIDFSHLYLTCSMDWTIKLWSLKEKKPLYSFEDSGDYVMDARWSPVHPAAFAAVDASGKLDLWNLNQDTEVPAATIQAENNVAFNRVSWTPNGSHVVAGDHSGRIHIYDAGQFSTPRSEEWSKLVYTLQELRNNSADDDDKINLTAVPPSGPPSLTSLPSMAANPLSSYVAAGKI